MAAAGAALAWSDANHYVTSQSLFCYCCCAPSFPPSLRCKPGLFVPQLVRQKKTRDPSHNSPGQPRGAPSPAPASLLGQCPAACYCHRAVSPAFSGLPITPVVILNLLSFSPSTCLYLLKPWLSPPHPPPEYFVSAPVSREQPSARLPPGSLPIYETSHHFFFFPSSFVVVVVGILFALRLSAVPQPHKGIAGTQQNHSLALQCVTHGSYDFIFPRTLMFT